MTCITWCLIQVHLRITAWRVLLGVQCRFICVSQHDVYYTMFNTGSFAHHSVTCITWCLMQVHLRITAWPVLRDVQCRSICVSQHDVYYVMFNAGPFAYHSMTCITGCSLQVPLRITTWRWEPLVVHMTAMLGTLCRVRHIQMAMKPHQMVSRYSDVLGFGVFLSERPIQVFYQ